MILRAPQDIVDYVAANPNLKDRYVVPIDTVYWNSICIVDIYRGECYPFGSTLVADSVGTDPEGLRAEGYGFIPMILNISKKQWDCYDNAYDPPKLLVIVSIPEDRWEEVLVQVTLNKLSS